ncbi:hypoxanthine phosphoribosyltransferase [Ureaplasma ceti]|uniref:Hypoxanthine phosphoribosyltransferase n=1 Tax=Ureaplasma ceti TaxID=3119530 RepID=A0ABP9U9M9_9BACT
MANVIDPRIKEVLFTEEQLEEGIQKAADYLNKEYAGKTPVVVGILKGCIPFIGKILTKLTFDLEIDFMAASSFKGGTKSTGIIELALDLRTDIEGRDVLILEDIIDTAKTLKMIVEMLKARNPKSIKIVTLLDKKEGRQVDLEADYYCFEIPMCFIVGFGFDYKEILRNLPYIGILDEKVYMGDSNDPKERKK